MSNATQTPKLSMKSMVTLDALLDIRLGIITYTNPELATRLASDPQYYRRTSETFRLNGKQMTGKELMSLLPANKADILPYCSRTTCWEFVMEMMVSRLNANTNRFSFDEIALDINVYPFEITAQESAMIAQVFSEMCDHLFPVNCVYLPPTQLSTGYVSKSYLDLIMYDPADWINGLGNTLYKAELRDVILYTPKVFQLRELTEEEKAVQQKHGMTLMDAMVDLMAPVLAIRFLPIQMFCIESPLNLIRSPRR